MRFRLLVGQDREGDAWKASRISVQRCTDYLVVGELGHRMADTESRTIERVRVPLRLEPALVDWVNENSQDGGPFGGPSHAADRAIRRMQVEHAFIQESCRANGVPFRAKAFWGLYAQELDASPAQLAGRPAADEGVLRTRIYVTVSTNLLDWADKVCISGGPFEGMSQVVEVGLRRLQAGEARLKAGDSEPKITLPPGEFWRRYEKLLGSEKSQ